MNAPFDTEKSDERILHELKDVLTRLEGPPAPTALARSPGECGSRRRWVVIAFVTLLAAAAAISAVIAFAVPRGGGSSEACAARLVFQGRLYDGVGVSRGSLALGEELGEAIQPECRDSLTRSDSGSVTIEGSPAESVTVKAISGVDPRVAIGRPDDPGGVYVQAGRCANYGRGEAAFLTCLRSPLTFDGRLYIETRLRTPSLHERFRLGGKLDDANSPGGVVPVFRLQSIDPTTAVGRPGDRSLVYIADRKCMISSLAQLADCLRQH